jgi:hypothetical protein
MKRAELAPSQTTFAKSNASSRLAESAAVRISANGRNATVDNFSGDPVEVWWVFPSPCAKRQRMEQENSD